MVSICDVVTIDAPLHPETEDLFNGTPIAKIGRGASQATNMRSR